jgi:tRNA (mo5U34)-methyltransferase
MSVYEPLYQRLDQAGLQEWRQQLEIQISERLATERHGKLPVWQSALAQLPKVELSSLELKDKVSIGRANDLSMPLDEFKDLLQHFHPWRKGPYHLFDMHLNTEWRSDWKWDRVLPHISSLTGRKVLDVGGGNGYHGWRMVGEGADLVMVIDPTVVFTMQYQAMQHFVQTDKLYVLPIGIEDMPELGWFDTVFSMGVLYHRRSPIDHLLELRACLKPKGELVLETLIVDGEEGMSLIPEQRYAKMRNVWFIPTIKTMLAWLTKCGFKNVRCVDEDQTSLEEQRTTEWMTFESLADFLDPNDVNKTIEGYPAPKRAVFVATAP